MRSRARRAVPLFAAVAIAVAAAPVAFAQTGSTIPWPQFHGANRDNISPDKGLMREWPAGGPKLLWKSAECGGGYAGISIADGRIYTSGDFGQQEAVIALDRKGKLLWKTPNGKAWKGPYPGARTNPTYSEGVLYHMGPTGRLAALKADSGEDIWAVDLGALYAVKVG